MANELLKTSAPAVGAGIGAGIGSLAGGIGAGPGALVGGAIGQALSSGLGLFEKVPELPGPSGAQLQAVGVQTRLMAQLSQMQGTNQQDVQNLVEFSRASTMNNLSAMNALPTQMNNVDRVNLARSIRSQMEAAGGNIDQMLDKYRAGSEFQRLNAVGQAAGQVSSNAANIKAQERQVEQFRLNQEQQKMQMFAQALQGVTTAAVVAGDMKTKAKKPLSADKVDINSPNYVDIQGDVDADLARQAAGDTPSYTYF